MTVSEIKSIIFSGASVALNAGDFSVLELKSIAFSAKSHNTKIIIKHAEKLSVMECKSIAFSGGGGGNIIFEFAD